VDITFLDGKADRKIRELDAALSAKYDLLINGGQTSKNPAIAMRIQPVCRSGEMILAIEGIPKDRINEFNSEFRPSLVMCVAPDDYTAVMKLEYDPIRRAEARNARHMVGNEICRSYSARSHSDSFLMPGVPQLLDKRHWVMPKLILKPVLVLSKAAQAMLAPAWAEIHEQQKQWWLRHLATKEKIQKLKPGALTSKLIHDQLKPLGVATVQPEIERNQKTLLSAPVPETARKTATKGAERTARQPDKKPSQPTSSTPALTQAGIEEEGRKVKLERMRKTIRLGLLSLKQNHEAIAKLLATYPGLRPELVATGERMLGLAAERGVKDAFEAFARNGPAPEELQTIWDDAFKAADLEKEPVPKEDFLTR
jgi:hypothetical protein